MTESFRIETFYPNQTLFDDFPIPFTWMTIPKYFIGSGWTNPIGIKPLTLFTRLSDGKIKYYAFAIFCYPYDKDNRIATINRLITFVKDPDLKKNVIKKILTECIRLAKLINAKSLELELYSESKGPISFPSGSSFLDEYNEKNVIDSCFENGFYLDQKKYCLQLDLNNKKNKKNRDIRNIKDNEKDRKQYLNLIRNGKKIIENKSDIYFGPRSYIGRNISFFSDPRITFVYDSGKIFKKIIGILNWAPNIYPCIKSEGMKAKYYDLDTILQRYNVVKVGKIFNLTVNKDKIEICYDLCNAAVDYMQKINFSFIQIGDISENENYFLNALYTENFKKVHEKIILKKDL